MRNNTNTILTTILGILVAAAVVGGIYYATTYKGGSPLPGIGPNTGQPSAPTASTRAAESISQSTALLNGTVNPYGAQTSFWYEYGTSETLGHRTSAQLLGAGYTDFSAPAVVIGLSPNTTYFYRIGAQNQYGVANGSIMSFTTTTSPPPVSGVPPMSQTAAANNVTETGATLTGVVNPKTYQTYFWFEYGKTTSFGNVTSVESAGAGGSDTGVSAQLSGLDPNTTYYYRLNAQNVWGTVNGSIFSFTTTLTPPQGNAPGVDTDIAGFVGRTSAVLNAKIRPMGFATTYWFEYGKAPLPGAFDLNSTTPAKSAGSGSGTVAASTSLSGLATSTTYYYRAVAENQNGKNFGAILNFTTGK